MEDFWNLTFQEKLRRLKELNEENRISEMLNCFANLPDYELLKFINYFNSFDDQQLLEENMYNPFWTLAYEELFYLDNIDILPSSAVASLFNRYNLNLKEVVSILSKANINKYKMALIINQTEVLNDEFGKMYHESLLQHCKNYNHCGINELLDELRDGIFSAYENLEDNDMLSLANGELNSIFNVEGINYLREKGQEILNDPEKSISVRWFDIFSQIIILSELAKINHYDMNVMSTMSLGDDYAFGEYYTGRIILNKENIRNSLALNLDLFDTIFHEVEHIKQNDGLHNIDKMYDYQTLCFAEQKMLEADCDNYNSIPFNYINSSMEIDARIKGYLNTFRFLSNNPELRKSFMQMQFINARNNLVSRDRRLKEDFLYKKMKTRISPDDNHSYSMQEMLDRYVYSDTIRDYMMEYPVLCAKYNFDGTKKSFEEIVELCNQAKIQMDVNKNKETTNIYLFYLQVLRDYIETYKLGRVEIMKSSKQVVEEFEEDIRRGSK